MGIFSSLFGKPDYKDSIIRAGLALADETERVYRNQLESTPPTGIGLLKARLFSVSFPAAAYIIADCSTGDNDRALFTVACSGIAMRPFDQPGANPKISKQQTESFAGPFMMKALKLIQAEIADGPSTLDRKTKGFQKLANMYHHCLAESVGENRYKTTMLRDLDTVVESVVWTHFRFLGDLLQQVRR